MTMTNVDWLLKELENWKIPFKISFLSLSGSFLNELKSNFEDILWSKLVNK